MKHPKPLHPETTYRLSRLRSAIAQLADAWVYADDRQCGPWEFAVALADLVAQGLTTSDLRWLVSKGYAKHAAETTGPHDTTRTFRRGHNLSFPDKTCVVLTDAGVSYAAAVMGKQLPLSTFRVLRCDNSAWRRKNVPRWDNQRRELRVGEWIVKKFRIRSPNQEAVLTAFQEEGWPKRIDDPLRPQAEQNCKCRLHDTIKSLNRHHQHRLILFRGDGTGQGICWESIGDFGVPLSAEGDPKKIRLAA